MTSIIITAVIAFALGTLLGLVIAGAVQEAHAQRQRRNGDQP